MLMVEEDWLYVQDPYLDHLIFGSDQKNIRDYFEYITSWVDNHLVDEQEAKFLLTEMVQDLFDIQKDVSFGYRPNVITKIKQKQGFSLIQQAMKAEIMRLYYETQHKLKNENDGQTILLYRGLSLHELDPFYKNPSILKTNTLVSFTTDETKYKREVQVSVEVPIKNVLFYQNLCPFSEREECRCRLGLHIENEVIVMNGIHSFDIKEVTRLDSRSKERREAEARYL